MGITEKEIQVIKKFLNKEQSQIDFLKSTGHKLISYGTCIAEWLDSPINVINCDIMLPGEYSLVINSTIYFPKTFHFDTLINLIDNKYMYLRVGNIPKGTQELWKNKLQ